MKNDRHIVVIRPKTYFDSSGNTWANETEKLRLLYPDEFEAKNLGKSYSKHFRSLCAAVRDDVFLYVDMIEEGDILKVPTMDICKHCLYERQRLEHVARRAEIAELQWNINFSLCSEFEKLQGNELLSRQKDLIATAKAILAKPVTGNSLRGDFTADILRKANHILDHIVELNLPPVKPNWADLTDAGPGVGVSHYEVRFRDAELARIHRSEYRVRVHRSRGDSRQNEAERTNSAISDSVVDGSTIDWNFYKRFDDLTDKDIVEVMQSDFEIYKKNRMSKNAWRVAEIVRERVDDVPVLGDFISALLAEKNDSHNFFFNKMYLKEHQNAAQHKKSDVPGSSYIEKILKFIETHYKIGELFFEYLYRSCCTESTEYCSFCSDQGWTSPLPIKGIPQPIPDAK